MFLRDGVRLRRGAEDHRMNVALLLDAAYIKISDKERYKQILKSIEKALSSPSE